MKKLTISLRKMKNLVISVCQEIDFDDIDPNAVICLTDEGPVSYSNGIVRLHLNDATCEIVDLDPHFAQEGIASQICSGLVCLADGLLVAAFDSGILMSIEVTLKTVEIVGNLDAGLDGIWKSPDDEVLVLSAKDGAIILMTSRDFEPLLEFNPDVENDAALANINVGWGAKETQFHGSIGKAGREVSKESPDTVQDNEDHKAKIVWRDDGQFFALSHVSRLDQIRKIRVFSREGQLQSTSETVRALGTCLAWKPCGGSLIASSTKLANGKDVIGFFEKNGLRHGDFLLQNNAKVMEVSWNSDASILMVHLMLEEDSRQVVQLWVASNYKWQLKQHWPIVDKCLDVLWDPISPLTLFIFTEKSGASKIELGWKVHHSLGKNEQDLSYVAIIDGSVLKMTPFRQMIIPPPISAFELHFNENITAVMFAHNILNAVAVITENNMIHMFTPHGSADLNSDNNMVKITGAGGSGFTSKCDLVNLSKSVTCPDASKLTNWCWINDNLALASKSETIYLINLENGSILESNMCENIIANISASADNVHCVLLLDGSVLQLAISDDKLNMDILPWEECQTLPTNCTNLELVNHGDGCHILALNERSQRLYLNGKEISTGITSFSVHSDFLMLTTVKHTLKCLPLSRLNNFKEDADSLWQTESVRALERGSKLVLVVPNDTRTVLQMPRGNLEVIHPRALALHILKTMLDKCQYKRAMEILRRQRINLNLIIDHNPGLLKDNVALFLEQVVDSHRLCVFIADLM